MRLLRVHLHNVGPFGDVVLRLAEDVAAEDDIEDVIDEEGSSTRPAREEKEKADQQQQPPPPVVALSPRSITVLFGADGTGKTSFLSALAVTRPGHALPPLPSTRESRGGAPP